MNILDVARGLAVIALATTADAIATAARIVSAPPGSRMATDAHRWLGSLHMDRHGPDESCEYGDCAWCWRNLDLAPSTGPIYPLVAEPDVDDDSEEEWDGEVMPLAPDIWAEIHKDDPPATGWRTP